MDESRALQLLYRALNEVAKQWQGTKDEWNYYVSEMVGITEDELEYLDERGLIPIPQFKER